MANLEIEINNYEAQVETENGYALKELEEICFTAHGIRSSEDWDAVKLKIESLISKLNHKGGDVTPENLQREVLGGLAQPLTSII